MPTLREANQVDEPALSQLLRAHDLRTEGVLHSGTRYWVAEDGGRIVGAIGVEFGETSVLLRSAIIAPEWRGQGLGQALVQTALDCARRSRARFAYCFSTDAGGYWTARGFEVCLVAEVVAALPSAPQVLLFDQLGWLPAEVAYKLALSARYLPYLRARHES